MKIIFAINDLHSNMVKFKWLIILKLWKNKGIYIPIWLNSNKELSTCSGSLKRIYIPIWLNSNAGRSFKNYYSVKIYIPIWLNSNEINRCLFFSLFLIYIPIWLNSNHTCGCGNSYQDSDLHSNMVKFK